MTIDPAPAPAVARVVVGPSGLTGEAHAAQIGDLATLAEAPILLLDDQGAVLEVPNLLEPLSRLLARTTGETRARVEVMLRAAESDADVKQHLVSGATEPWRHWFGYWRQGTALAPGDDVDTAPDDGTWQLLSNITSADDPTGHVRLRFEQRRVIPGERNRRIVEKLRPDLGPAPSSTYNDAHESVKAEMLAQAGTLLPSAVRVTMGVWTVDTAAQVVRGEKYFEYEFEWQCTGVGAPAARVE